MRCWQGCWELLRTRGSTITAAHAALDAALGSAGAADAASRAPRLLRTSAYTLAHSLPALEALLLLGGRATARNLAMRNLELMRCGLSFLSQPARSSVRSVAKNRFCFHTERTLPSPAPSFCRSSRWLAGAGKG